MYVRSISVRSMCVYDLGVFILSLRYTALGYIFELDADVDLGFVESLSGFEYERYAFPSGIVEPRSQRSVCGTYRVSRDGVITKVT